MRKMNIIFMGIILWMSSPFFVYGQLLDPVSYEITTMPEEFAAGSKFIVEIEALIEEGWYLYSSLNDPDDGPYPTTITSGSDSMVIAGPVEESDAEVRYDPNFRKELGLHSGRALFSVPVAFRTDHTGSQMVELRVLYQACDDISCLPPVTRRIFSPVTILPAGDHDDIDEWVLLLEEEERGIFHSGDITRNHFLLAAFLLIGCYLLVRFLRRQFF